MISATNLGAMFQSATSFNQDIGDWNISNATNMGGMFRNATAFNNGGVGGVGQGLDKWNTSNVTDMNFTFSGNESFNQYIGSWDVSNVTTFDGMFGFGATFNQDITGWNTASAEQMGRMFLNNANFDQDLSGWNISNLLGASNMFTGSGLTTPNYDALLIGWAAQAPNIQNSVTLSSVPCQYTSAAQSARDVLTGTYGWTIIDQGVVPGVMPTIQATETTTDSLSTGSGSMTANLPAGIVSGELLLLLVGIDNSDNIMTAPTGYTELAKGPVDIYGVNVYAWIRTADGTEGSTIALPYTSGSSGYDVICYALRIADVGATAPIASQIFGNWFSSAMTLNSYAAVNNDTLFVAVLGYDGSDAAISITAGSPPWPATFNEYTEYPTASPGGLTFMFVTQEVVTAGTMSGAITAGGSLVDGYQGLLLQITGN